MSELRVAPTMTVNQVLLLYPGTVGVFQSLGIHTCCGGPYTLQEAARLDGVAVQQLLDALDAHLILEGAG
jgi:iron-sulfur cluster repair protein YtfE (RIC family)